jgi:pimeloyl-ACP methyl ester carboxylesterase
MPVDLAATEFGAGEPLIILHGLFGSARNWSSIAQRIAAAHHVFALDARNHGASPWDDTMSYPAMADDVAAFRDARHLGAVTLMGHSMGGKTAMLLALQRPALVTRLVVVDVAPVPYRPSLRGYIQAMRAADLGTVARRADVDAQLVDAVADPAERAFLLQNLVLDPGHVHWRLNLPVLERTIEEISSFPDLPPEARFDGPTLFVVGARSRYMRPEYEPVVRRLFPQASIAIIADAGHWLHAERPAAFLDAALPFLSGAPRPDG